jgi:hypothetical protein
MGVHPPRVVAAWPGAADLVVSGDTLVRTDLVRTDLVRTDLVRTELGPR